MSKEIRPGMRVRVELEILVDEVQIKESGGAVHGWGKDKSSYVIVPLSACKEVSK